MAQNKIIACVLLFLGANISFSQNLVPNPSFETGSGSPFCPAHINIADRIDYWANAEIRDDPNACWNVWSNCHSTSDWIDYSLSCSSHPVPHTSDRYVLMAHEEGIRTTLLTRLQAGHTYKLRFRFAGLMNPVGLNIYLTELSVHWQDKSAKNQRLEIPGISTDEITNYTNNTWFTVERYITVPNFFDKLENIVFLNAGTDAPNCLIDDVELYDNGCCPEYMLYENTSALPNITHVEKYIIAGYDAGIIGTQGDVNILPGQNVTFKAGNFIQRNPGFNSEPGSVFTQIIENCTLNSSPTLDPINQSIIPNIFHPDGSGVNDKFCITAQGFQSYKVQIFNRYGNLIFEGFNTVEGDDFGGGAANNFANPINTNYQCLWDGTCNRGICNNGTCVGDGTYDYIITLFNCNDEVNFTGNVLKLGHVCRMMNAYPISTQQSNADSASEMTRFIIMPNPSDGVFEIRFKEELSNGNIYIYNGLGKIVYEAPIERNSIQVDISTRAKGVYLVKVKTAEGLFLQKIILQ